MHRFFAFIFLLIAVAMAQAAEPYRVDVVLLEHRDLPMLSEKETDEVLSLSAKMIARVYGREVIFRVAEKREFFEFIREQRQRIAPYRRPLRESFDVFRDNPRAFRADVAESIRNYGALDEIAVWLPQDQQVGITTYDDAALRFIARYESALKVVKSLKSKSGKPVLTPDNWLDFAVTSYDDFYLGLDAAETPLLFLSNTLIVDDLLVHAAPHSLVRGIAHGLTWPVNGRAMVGYQVHLAGDPRITGYPWKLSDGAKRSAIAYTVAHEIGTHLMSQEFDDYAADALVARPMPPKEDALQNVEKWSKRTGGRKFNQDGFTYVREEMRLKIAIAQGDRKSAEKAVAAIKSLKIDAELVERANRLFASVQWK